MLGFLKGAMPCRTPCLIYFPTLKCEQFGEKKGVEQIGFRVNLGQKTSFLEVCGFKYSDPYGMQEEAFIEQLSRHFQCDLNG